MEKDFEEMSLFNITQILRGSYFILIDNLLCNIQEPKSKEPLENIINLFKLHIKMTVQFFKKLPSLYNDVILFLFFHLY